MAMRLYDLAGADPKLRFSPYCWRAKFALAHKGLAVETMPWRFTEKDVIAFSGSERVPVLLDGDKTIPDSWAIACYLEDAYPDRPSLFGGAGGRALGRMLNWWGDIAVIGGMFPLIVADIPSHLKPVDAVYFRQSREARFGKPLEEVVAGGAVEAGDAVTLGAGVPLVGAVVDGPGGDVARGGGQFSRESANNFRSCDSA